MNQSNTPLVSSLKSFSRASSYIVIVVGWLVLVGWAFNIAALKSVFPALFDRLGKQGPMKSR